MKKRTLNIVVIMTILIVGGFIMKSIFTGKDITKNREVRIVHKEEQDRLKDYLVKNIEISKNEELKKISFIQFEKDDLVGNWMITVKINDKYLISLNEDKLGGEIRTSGYSPSELKEKKISNPDIKNKEIEVDYFEGD